MNEKMRMVWAITLALSILSITFLATPALAYANGIETGDQEQDQERLRLRDGSCNGDMQRARDRTQKQDCDCDCTGDQYRERYGPMNGIDTVGANLERYRHQYGR